MLTARNWTEDPPMTPDSPLHRALSAWRVAERRLSMTGVDDPSRPSLVAGVERRRLAYQTQFDAVEDVAGHGAPYADDADAPSEPHDAPSTTGDAPVGTASS
jgi:hypothetical protein